MNKTTLYIFAFIHVELALSFGPIWGIIDLTAWIIVFSLTIWRKK